MRADGEVVGHITSAVWSPRLEKNIGYAMVSTAHAELGSELVVETPGGDATATVVRRPFIDPEKEIPKS